jgi:hypothetical protein
MSINKSTSCGLQGALLTLALGDGLYGLHIFKSIGHFMEENRPLGARLAL